MFEPRRVLKFLGKLLGKFFALGHQDIFTIRICCLPLFRFSSSPQSYTSTRPPKPAFPKKKKKKGKKNFLAARVIQNIYNATLLRNCFSSVRISCGRFGVPSISIALVNPPRPSSFCGRWKSFLAIRHRPYTVSYRI